MEYPTVLLSIIYQAESVASVLEFAVIAPPPFEAIVPGKRLEHFAGINLVVALSGIATYIHRTKQQHSQIYSPQPLSWLVIAIFILRVVQNLPSI